MMYLKDINDNVGVTIDGNNYVVSGCEGVVTAEGNSTNVALSKVNIDGTEYNYTKEINLNNSNEDNKNTTSKKFRKIIYTIGQGDVASLASSLLKQNSRL